MTKYTSKYAKLIYGTDKSIWFDTAYYTGTFPTSDITTTGDQEVATRQYKLANEHTNYVRDGDRIDLEYTARGNRKLRIIVGSSTLEIISLDKEGRRERTVAQVLISSPNDVKELETEPGARIFQDIIVGIGEAVKGRYGSDIGIMEVHMGPEDTTILTSTAMVPVYQDDLVVAFRPSDELSGPGVAKEGGLVRGTLPLKLKRVKDYIYADPYQNIDPGFLNIDPEPEDIDFDDDPIDDPDFR